MLQDGRQSSPPRPPYPLEAKLRQRPELLWAALPAAGPQQQAVGAAHLGLPWVAQPLQHSRPVASAIIRQAERACLTPEVTFDESYGPHVPWAPAQGTRAVSPRSVALRAGRVAELTGLSPEASWDESWNFRVPWSQAPRPSSVAIRGGNAAGLAPEATFDEAWNLKVPWPQVVRPASPPPSAACRGRAADGRPRRLFG